MNVFLFLFFLLWAVSYILIALLQVLIIKLSKKIWCQHFFQIDNVVFQLFTFFIVATKLIFFNLKLSIEWLDKK